MTYSVIYVANIIAVEIIEDGEENTDRGLDQDTPTERETTYY